MGPNLKEIQNQFSEQGEAGLPLGGTENCIGVVRHHLRNSASSMV
jgi:hypothetical protein